ncbi:MAG: DUF4097 family beta strand repeat-containing protein [Armatimonadota bacterium]
MKAKLHVVFTLIITILLVSGVFSAPRKTLMDELGLPALPGSRITTEANLPPGKMIDSIAREYGPWLGLSELKQVGIITFAIDPGMPTQQVMKFYEPAMSDLDWKTITKSVYRDSAIAILYSEKKGMLIMNIDPPGKKSRQMTLVRVLGKLDPDKLADPNRAIPDRVRQWIDGPFGPEGEIGLPETVARIPAGQPISIPPSKWLQIKSLRSNIKAYAANQNTVTIRLAARADDTGELVRTNTGLVLSLSPRLPVDEVSVPNSVPVILQVTEGALTFSGGLNAAERPSKLNIVATSAPVDLESFPLISGTHTIRSVGGKVQIELSQVQAGNLEVEVTGNDLTITLPKDASARIEAAATSGKVLNQTGIDPQKSGSDYVSLQMGAGKAMISLQAVNGNVCIKTSK